ncbi:hypothetical protein MKW92_050088, partial [Papaver armeniacum]
MPVTDLSSQVIKCFSAAGNLVLFHVYFHMFTLATIGNCLKLIGPDAFLHYSWPISRICGSVTSLGEGIQVYRYLADIHSRYYARLKSYDFYRLSGQVYQTMEGYIKLEFNVRAMGSQSWFIVNYSPYVLLVVTPLSYELVSTVFYSVRILLMQLLDLCLSPTMISGWAKSLVLGVNLFGWSDTHILLKLLTSEDYEKIWMSKRAAHYVEKLCNTRSQSFKDNYLIMLLRQCSHCTFIFAK